MTDDLQTASPVPVAPVDVLPAAEVAPAVEDRSDWSWPPYAPLEPAGGRRFDCEDWAPSSIVRRPRLRVGRWTLLYRRGS